MSVCGRVSSSWDCRRIGFAYLLCDVDEDALVKMRAMSVLWRNCTRLFVELLVVA